MGPPNTQVGGAVMSQMAIDPNIGWVTKSKAMKMIREHFSNLDDFTDNEVIQILAKIGIEMDFDLSLGTAETPQFHFISFKDKLRKKLSGKDENTPESIEDTVNKSEEWTDLLMNYPSKQMSS